MIFAQDIKQSPITAVTGIGPVVIFLRYGFSFPVYTYPITVMRFSIYTNNGIRGPQRGLALPRSALPLIRNWI